MSAARSPRAANADPGRARAAPARRHLPPRPPPDALHHTSRSLAELVAGRGRAPGPAASRSGRRRGARGAAWDGAHSGAAGCRQGNAASPAARPGGPAAPAPRAPRDSPPSHLAPAPGPLQCLLRPRSAAPSPSSTRTLLPPFNHQPSNSATIIYKIKTVLIWKKIATDRLYTLGA